ncbi:1-deoxy-D-xylulose-5-phosphate reductoisomerase [candidate division KSB1 bacterium]|nr:1-deoxy-D-xylulose-5-phosphate reductoisomerase [candidate division KSB1 bacterium]MBL7093439.1 1-deoxy-D-xylulose-5-phosphate reductoisomerase [candidate division KSB1 bacterium]
MKRITILGSTGSIGRNALEVVEGNRDEFEVIGLSTHQRVELLYQQCLIFKPKMVCITGNDFPIELFEKLKQLEIDVVTGKDGLRELASRTDVDVLLNALVGSAGLLPTLDAIEKNIDIALANKETLVMAGEIITSFAKQKGVKILPVDSEHSAIFQCLQGENAKTISRLLLTASGGPFYDFSINELKDVTVEQALDHPNWEMGKKITIDSATMMNKGLEVIEAHWLFHIPISQIEVVVHQQSIIHSFVEFIDGSLKAQLGAPDMKVPIQYALTYPNRHYLQTERLNFDTLKKLTFDKPDYKKFPACVLAYESIKKGGTAPAVLNAANEVAVFYFLNKKIRFPSITKFVEQTLEKHREIQNPTIDEIIAADVWARNFVNEAVRKEEILQVSF